MSAEQFDGARSETQSAASMLELTGIFHRHGTAEHANTSAELIPAGSVAYVEGLKLTDHNDLLSLGSVLTGLAHHRREFGMDREYHRTRDQILKITSGKQSLKQRLTGLFKDTKLERASGGEFSFTEHENTLTTRLLEKHCDVITADYRHFELEGEEGAQYQIATEAIRTMLAESQYSIMREAVETGDEDKYLRDMRLMFARETVVNRMRESSASVWIQKDADEIMSNPRWYDSVAKNNDGKIIGSVTYGTAHAHSLTSVLREDGIAITPHIIEPVKPWMYFDPAWRIEGKNLSAPNYYQRLTHAAFCALVVSVGSRLTEPYEKQYVYSTQDEMYPLLERMRGHGDEAAEFSKRCIRINRKLHQSRSAALNDFATLVQEQRDANPTLAQQ